MECANYTGITLLNVTNKVFSNIVYTRLLPRVESKLGQYKGGFRSRRSTINQIFGKDERIYDLYPPTFTDFKSAHDSTDRDFSINERSFSIT